MFSPKGVGEGLRLAGCFGFCFLSVTPLTVSQQQGEEWGEGGGGVYHSSQQ